MEKAQNMQGKPAAPQYNNKKRPSQLSPNKPALQAQKEKRI